MQAPFATAVTVDRSSRTGLVIKGHEIPWTEIDRFWSFIESKSQDVCWEWPNCTDQKGYGFFRVGKQSRAHRMAWQFFHMQVIPTGLLVMHSCDNPPCVNPHHLSIGTVKDNADDMWLKNRGHRSRGELNNHNKISADKAAELKSTWPSYTGTLRDFCKTHAVPYPATWSLLNGRSWQWL